MKEINSMEVGLCGRKVGVIAQTRDGKCAFQYDGDWQREGFSLNPFSLPLTDKVYLPKTDVFEGLFGIFADSLPDGWGRLLVDRMLLANGIAPATVRALVRLGIVGSAGMGALEYFPELAKLDERTRTDFDRISGECEMVLREEDGDGNLDDLFRMGGSSGGARPKILIKIEGEPWIVKFPSTYDPKSIGREEYRYMQCARRCGIMTPETKLLPSAVGEGYFGIKRFDRAEGRKVHMATVSALLETSHRIPNLDYHDLMKLTYLLTKDHVQMEEMYRRMCFNVFAHNRDDHSKNFSYLYDGEEMRWKLTPAYDLTYSNSIGGEHATCVNGNGRDPGREDLLAVGRRAGLAYGWLRKTMLEIEEIVAEDLDDILGRHI